jgi:hypothetical protein
MKDILKEIFTMSINRNFAVCYLSYPLLYSVSERVLYPATIDFSLIMITGYLNYVLLFSRSGESANCLFHRMLLLNHNRAEVLVVIQNFSAQWVLRFYQSSGNELSFRWEKFVTL